MTKNMTPNPMQPRRVFGADEDAPYFVGRKLYWTEVKEAAPGFLAGRGVCRVQDPLPVELKLC